MLDYLNRVASWLRASRPPPVNACHFPPCFTQYGRFPRSGIQCVKQAKTSRIWDYLSFPFHGKLEKKVG